jgi:hypothetical protein
MMKEIKKTVPFYMNSNEPPYHGGNSIPEQSEDM